MNYSLALAHLSDLHFGDKSRFSGKDEKDLGKMCAQAIMNAMQSNFDKAGPDLVVVTGDITERAEEREFIQAGKFFDSLQQSLGIARSKFVFTPGNHDVSWNACQMYFALNPDKRNQASDYDRDLEQLKFEFYNKFKEKFYGDNQPVIKEFNRGAALYVYEDYQLCITALNSCLPITNKEHIGVINYDQAEEVMNALLKDYENYIKIVALHHAVNSIGDRVHPWIKYLKNKCEQIDKISKLLDKLQSEKSNRQEIQNLKEMCAQQEIKSPLLNKLGKESLNIAEIKTLKEDCEKKKIQPDLFIKLENDALSVGGNEYIASILEDCHVHLALHGHQHSYEKPHPVQWRDLAEYCQIYPAGSFGLRPDKMPADQPNCLRLLHLCDCNNRLELNTVSLEYDPLERLVGSLIRGCFRDIGKKTKASFPLDPPFHSLHGSPKRETDSAEEADRTNRATVQMQIEGILLSSPAFCETLARQLKERNDAERLAQALVEKGFIKVWRSIVGRLDVLKTYFEDLQRVLFLLAQGAIKRDMIETIRKQLESEQETNIFDPPIRDVLMAELILKAAFGTEISIDQKKKEGRLDAVPRSLITIPKLEHGIVGSKRQELLEKLYKMFPNVAGSTEGDRFESLKDCLFAHFISLQPYYTVHDDSSSMDIPYMVEFKIPSRDESISPDNVTHVPEARLCELIKIILEKCGDIQQ